MARVTIERAWPDGDAIRITVGVEGSYPDAVAEARANARSLYADALDITLADAEDEGDPAFIMFTDPDADQ